jgi:hypothetical protein
MKQGSHSAEEIGMAKVLVYYFTFFDKAKGKNVRPRRPGTLEAIASTRRAHVKPLLNTALEVDESELDDEGFYPRR